MALVFQSHTLGQGGYCCYSPCFPYSASGAACAPGFVVRCVATFRPGSILNISPSLLSRPFLGGAGQKWHIRHSKPHLQKQLHKLTVTDAAGPKDGVKWWEKEGAPNMYDIHTTQDFVDQLANAGDKLVVVEFYATWCGSCRALYPKLCKLAEENANVVFLKVNFDENKPMCKRLNVRVLPYFHFYRGADGRLDGFSCSLAKLQKLRDAIALHNTDRCSIGPPLGAGDIDLLSIINTTDKPTPAGVS